uniref:EMAP like 2 n=1 Tax=Cavia porcellus TaxID=10141 RepID=A0A286XTP8_CAVPO
MSSFGPGKTKEVIFSMEEGSVKMFLRGRPVPMLIPDELAPTYSLDSRSELPSRHLKLDWVYLLLSCLDFPPVCLGGAPDASSYGYRGRDCRANLCLLPTGEIVYFVASVAVLYSVEEQRQRHYLGHNDDIKCLAVHPDMVTIATGQVAGTTKEGKPLPPHVRIWDSVSLSTLHVLGLGMFDRAVCCVGFSKSNGGNLLCAVDESNDHMLSVWDWAKEAKVVDSKDPACSAGFHPSGSVLAVGTVTGRWLLLDTETNDLVAIHTDGNEQISVVSFSPDGAYLAVGSHDNLVYVYTVDQGGRKVSRLGKCSGHSSFITHLDWAQDSSCFVTNSGDYEILYWDPVTCKQITNADTVRNMEWATATCVLGFGVFGIWSEGVDGTDINAVARSHDGKLLASADDFGKVHLFSYPCCQPRALSHKYSGHSSHVTNVAFLWDDSVALTTGGKDTSVLQWRVV